MAPSFHAFFDEFTKIAEEATIRQPQTWSKEELEEAHKDWESKAPPSRLKSLSQAALGGAVGGTLGRYSGKGIEYLAGRHGVNLSPYLPAAGMAVGVLAGAAAGALSDREREADNRVREHQQQKPPSIPR